MTEFLRDGFDKYGPVGQSRTVLQNLLSGSGEWTAVTVTNNPRLALVAGLSSTGLAVKATAGPAGDSNGSITLNKTTGNSSRYCGFVRLQVLDLSHGSPPTWVQALKGSTAQWSITVNLTTGLLSLRTGGTAGTALATSSIAVGANTTHTLSWDVTVGSAGAYTVYLDGVSIMTGTGNTRGDGANNNADSFLLGAAGTTQDDFILMDGAGPNDTALLIAEPRIETQFPTADSQAQFSFGAGVLGDAYSNGLGGASSPGSNQLFLRRFTAEVAGTLVSASLMPNATSATAKYKAVLYADSAGSPNGQSLLGTGSEVVGCTSGTALTSAYTSPPSLTAGTSYWIGFITDTSVSLTTVAGVTAGVRATNTYTAGAPGTCPSVTAGQSDWQVWGNLTGVTGNWSAVNNNPAVGDLSYVSSSTVGQEDLFGFPGLTGNPRSIYSVAVKAYGRKTDSGARTINLQTKSSGTDAVGTVSGIAALTGYTWQASVFETDPATGLAWTTAGLNAAVSGVKIAT